MISSARQIPLLDLHPQNDPIRAEIMAAVERVLDSQKFILGDDVRLLEEELALYLRVPHAISCASGSDALFLALLALDIGPGDAVLTTPFSFFATAGSIARAGALPVFADIDPRTFNLDPLAVERIVQLNSNIKAVLPVHLYGGCADMDPLCDIARRRGWAVIEDAAQAIGAEYNGRRATTLGVIGCLSFFPTKNLGGFGDGGLLTALDPGIARKLSALRVHGSFEKYRHEWVGINSRLDTLQAAVLRAKLPHLDDWTALRQRNAALYSRFLAAADAPVVVPQPAPYQTRHVFNQFVIRCPNREGLRSYLASQAIGTEVYYPLPLHLQPCFSYLGLREGDLPESEKASREVLALPIHSGLSEDDVAFICDRIGRFYRG